MPISATSAQAATRTLSVDEALERILARVVPLPAVEVALSDALGTVLAIDVRADRDVPPFRNSAMDGYAVRGADVVGAMARLQVIGEIAAGQMPDRTVHAGEAMRIMTGAPMPDGSDTVVRVEDTDDGRDTVTITKAVPLGLSVRAAGEDLRAGEIVLRAGTMLRPAELGVLATLGLGAIRIVPRPRVTVLSTGDELVELDGAVGPGQIRDANRYSLAAAARACGAIVETPGIVRDTADELRIALATAAARADVIVTSGGVSVGDHDHVKPVVNELGSMDFWSIAIRPGRPLAFGEIRHGQRLVPIFGLPGNPVSSLLTFELFVRPALLRLAGRTKLERPRSEARLLEAIDTPPGLRFFARGIHDPRGRTVRTTGPQGSGILRSMSLANCLIDIPAETDHLDAGTTVTVIRTDELEDH
ncbi:MAG: molybdopterin molybdotransferase MoeA [Candidatus Limnocylindrales bacterium]